MKQPLFPGKLKDMKLIVEASQAMSNERSSALLSSPTNTKEAASQYVIGADIGGTSLRLALADGTGAIVGRWSASTTSTVDATMVLRLMREGVDFLLREASLPQESLRAIAAGAPGVTNVDKGIVIATSYLMGWRDVPLRQMLEAEFGVPAFVDNDVNLAAIGELRTGLAQGANDFIFLAIGTGIGAGIVLKGEVHRGSIWTAGEIGYMLVPGTSDAPIKLGEPGALESLVGGEGIRQQWQSRWIPNASALPKDATATQIFDHALESNSLALEVLQLAARTLAYAIYNISLILNSPLFVLGGSVGIHPALGDATRLMLDGLGGRVQPRLICSALGADAQLIGAIFLALQTANKQTALAGS
jgi:predicted NBD/HSP70 family sugar kinase